MFQDLFERSYQAIFILDPQSHLVKRANHYCATMLGYESCALAGMRFPEIVDSSQRADILTLLNHVSRGEAAEPIELTMLAQDGRRVSIELILFRISAPGEPLMLALCRDLSERKKQEQEIRNVIQQFIFLNEVSSSLAVTRNMTRLCEILYQNIASMVPLSELRVYLNSTSSDTLTPVYIRRPDHCATDVEIGRAIPIDQMGIERLVMREGRYVLLGDEADRVSLGLDPSETDGAECSILVAPMMLGADIIGLIRLSNDKPRSHSLFHLELLCNVANTAALAIRNAQLFDELSHTLRQVKDSEALLRGLVSQAPIALWIGTPDGQTVVANDPAREMFIAPGQIEAPAEINLLEDEQFLDQGVREDLGRVARGEVVQQELIRKNRHHPLRYRATFFPLRDTRGSVVNAVVMFEDVTGTRALEAQLRQAQKMEAIGTLAGGIAHDFNNLLTGVLGYSSYILERLTPEEKYHREITLIEKSAQRAAELTRQLLTFSRKTIPQKKRLDFNDVINETARILQRSLRHEIDLRLDLDTSLFIVEADATQLEQALLNLCINARDAMPSGGLLTIQSRNESLNIIEARQIPDSFPGSFVRVSVIDTGQGIASDNIERIFDPFFTTKEVGQGSGLGLAMVYGSVHAQGGFITVQSEIGKGSRFNLWFPISAQQETAEVFIEERRPVDVSGNETILVVDDEVHILELTESCLTPHGYRVLTAMSGPEALAKFGRRRGDIQLVLLDVLMPGMDGREVWKRISTIAAETCSVLFTSGYTGRELVCGKGLQSYNFLRKPYDTQELLEAVRKTLNREVVQIY